MNADLIRRLREEAEWRNAPQLQDPDEAESAALAKEAADEIERLQTAMRLMEDKESNYRAALRRPLHAADEPLEVSTDGTTPSPRSPITIIIDLEDAMDTVAPLDYKLADCSAEIYDEAENMLGNKLEYRVAARAIRLLRLLRLGAPANVLDSQRKLLEEAVQCIPPYVKQ